MLCNCVPNLQEPPKPQDPFEDYKKSMQSKIKQKLQEKPLFEENVESYLRQGYQSIPKKEKEIIQANYDKIYSEYSKKLQKYKSIIRKEQSKRILKAIILLIIVKMYIKLFYVQSSFFICDNYDNRQNVLLIDDIGRNHWYLKYFENYPCKYEIQNTKNLTELQTANQLANFSFGGPYIQLPPNLIGKQLSQWIIGSELVSFKYEFFQKAAQLEENKFYKNVKLSQFTPETYLLDYSTSNFSLSEEKMLRVVDSGIWYEKKSGWEYGKAEGNTFISNISQFQQNFKNQKQPEKNTKMKSVLQKNIDTYLYKGQKPEIRQTVLVASVDPFVVLFNEGFVSLTLGKYNNSLTGNDTIDKWNHISTFNQQSQNPLYNEESIRVDYTKMQLYMSDLFDYHINENKGTQQDIDNFKNLNKQMLTYYFTASFPFFTQKYFGQYHLFGCDIGINKQFQPQILECNAMPGTTGSFVEPSRKQLRNSIWQSLDMMLDIFEKSEGNKEKWTSIFKNNEFNSYDYQVLINQAASFNIFNQ